MEGLNKIISLFLGLIVVVIFFAVISGRINLKNKFPKLTGTKATITPTTTPKPASIKVTSEADQLPHPYKKPTPILTQTRRLTSIPATGAPTALIPLAFASFFGGMYLRKRL